MIHQNLSTLRKLMLLKGATGGSKAIEATATGNPLTFVTDLARPLKSLLIPFTPQQEGTGDPSPQNIRSILPWNGLKVFGGAKNLFNKDDPNVQLDKRVATGGTIINSQYSQAVTGFIPVKEGAKYIINSYVNQNYFSCFYSEKDISKPVGSIFENNKFPKTAPKGAKYLIVTIGNSGIDNFQIEVGTTATSYEPYKPITETDIVFPSAVYGGTLGVVSGVMTVTHVLWENNTADMDNDADYPGWKNAGIRDIMGLEKGGAIDTMLNVGSTVAINTRNANDIVYLSKSFYSMTQDEWKALAIDIQIALPLETPQEIQLTPTQITALIGNNTIWSDADGQLTAVYLKKG